MTWCTKVVTLFCALQYKIETKDRLLNPQQAPPQMQMDCQSHHLQVCNFRKWPTTPQSRQAAQVEAALLHQKGHSQEHDHLRWQQCEIAFLSLLRKLRDQAVSKLKHKVQVWAPKSPASSLWAQRHVPQLQAWLHSCSPAYPKASPPPLQLQSLKASSKAHAYVAGLSFVTSIPTCNQEYGPNKETMI